jgi:hypothetical protein
VEDEYIVRYTSNLGWLGSTTSAVYRVVLGSAEARVKLLAVMELFGYRLS